MKKLWLAVFVLIMAGSMAYSPALTQEKAKEKANETTRIASKKTASKKPHKLKLDKDGRPLSPKSVAERTALCKADCKPGNYNPATGVGIHGIYRGFADYDPNLTSIRGKKSYAECVKKCTDPLPDIYVQRAVFAAGITSWFGMTKEDCLNCHAKGH
jgi:hypothetical protein